MADLPRPVNTEQLYLKALCDLLVEQNALLTEMRDRLPRQGPAEPVSTNTDEPEDAVVLQLKEPAASPVTPKPTVKKTTTARAPRRATKKGS